MPERTNFTFSVLMTLFLAGIGSAAEKGRSGTPEVFPASISIEGPLPVRWPIDQLFDPPDVFAIDRPELKADGEIRPVLYAGLSYKGGHTKVFAWLGLPSGGVEKVPGMVLVHGGGGTAFRHWVKRWVDRGYAVIAMDTCGSMPLTGVSIDGNPRERRADGGPAGWGGFGGVDEPVHDQWAYHAVAAVILGHSLLRAESRVDPDRIGLTGISWGGYLTIIAAAIDGRFRFAAPVYGCGFLGENSSWQENVMQTMGRERALEWVRLWDPSHYMARAKLPMLFCNGTNDKHYRPVSWQKTYRLAREPRTISLKVRMPHGHPPAGDPGEIALFADSFLRGGPPLASIIAQGWRAGHAWVDYRASTPIEKAELIYTKDTGDWVTRTWHSLPAQIDEQAKRVHAAIPDGATVYYINLIDSREAVVSSEHEELHERI